MARPSTATLEGQRAGVNDHFGKPSLYAWRRRFPTFVISSRRAIPAVSGSSSPAHMDGPVGDHVAWGSDWPHTQVESVTKYPMVRASLSVPGFPIWETSGPFGSRTGQSLQV